MYTKALLAALIYSPVIASASDGRALYLEHCSSCHGALLEGQPDWRRTKEDGSLPAPPHNASGHTWHHPDQLLFDYVKLGGQEALQRMGVNSVTSAMPRFADLLSDQDIREILSYIKSTWPTALIEYQMQITENAK